jgi:hypothetical protein
VRDTRNRTVKRCLLRTVVWRRRDAGEKLHCVLLQQLRHGKEYYGLYVWDLRHLLEAYEMEYSQS